MKEVKGAGGVKVGAECTDPPGTFCALIRELKPVETIEIISTDSTLSGTSCCVHSRSLLN